MKNKINLLDFNALKKILKSESTEDVEIAYSNIKNLDLDGVYILMLAKVSSIKVRKVLLEDYNSLISDNKFEAIRKTDTKAMFHKELIDLSWNNIYHIISKYYTEDKDLRELFEFQFNNEILNTIKMINEYKFMESLNIKIKW